jgi:hypothetical protein
MARERGYRGSPDHFRHLIACHRPRPKAEAYLRLRSLPGEQAQVDWGLCRTRHRPHWTNPLRGSRARHQKETDRTLRIARPPVPSR